MNERYLDGHLLLMFELQFLSFKVSTMKFTEIVLLLSIPLIVSIPFGLDRVLHKHLDMKKQMNADKKKLPVHVYNYVLEPSMDTPNLEEPHFDDYLVEPVPVHSLPPYRLFRFLFG
jgi:hypothetical protein